MKQRRWRLLGALALVSMVTAGGLHARISRPRSRSVRMTATLASKATLPGKVSTALPPPATRQGAQTPQSPVGPLAVRHITPEGDVDVADGVTIPSPSL